MQRFALLTSLLSLSSFAGCALDESTDTDAQVDEPAIDDTTIFLQTVVTVAPDGSTTMSEPIEMTVAQQRTQNERRLAMQTGKSEAAFAVEDPGCTDAAIWLYSRTDFYGDRICFVGQGAAFLQDQSRYYFLNGRHYWAGSWAISQGSFWPGESPGRLSNHYDFVADGVDGRWSIPFASYGARSAFAQSTRAHNIVLYQ